MLAYLCFPPLSVRNVCFSDYKNSLNASGYLNVYINKCVQIIVFHDSASILQGFIQPQPPIRETTPQAWIDDPQSNPQPGGKGGNFPKALFLSKKFSKNNLKFTFSIEFSSKIFKIFSNFPNNLRFSSKRAKS